MIVSRAWLSKELPKVISKCSLVLVFPYNYHQAFWRPSTGYLLMLPKLNILRTRKGLYCCWQVRSFAFHTLRLLKFTRKIFSVSRWWTARYALESQLTTAMIYPGIPYSSWQMISRRMALTLSSLTTWTVTQFQLTIPPCVSIEAFYSEECSHRSCSSILQLG